LRTWGMVARNPQRPCSHKLREPWAHWGRIKQRIFAQSEENSENKRLGPRQKRCPES